MVTINYTWCSQSSILCLLMIASSVMAATKLPYQDAEQAKSKCAQSHGGYFERDDGSYGCDIGGGKTVVCSEGGCFGFVKASPRRIERPARQVRRPRPIQRSPYYDPYQQPQPFYPGWPFYMPR
jgi:hypothetical protein